MVEVRLLLSVLAIARALSAAQAADEEEELLREPRVHDHREDLAELACKRLDDQRGDEVCQGSTGFGGGDMG